MDLKNFEVEELKDLLNKDNFLLIDTRSSTDFADGYIPGSLYLSFEGNDAVNLNSIFTNEIEIGIIVTDFGEIDTVIRILNRYGFTRIVGYSILDVEQWKNAGQLIDLVIAIEADELAMDIPHDENIVLIDVRNDIEFAEGHLTGAQPLPLSEMGDPANIALIPESANIYLYCNGGTRSMTAASILKRHGLHNFRVVLADWSVIKESSGLKIEKDTGKLN